MVQWGGCERVERPSVIKLKRSFQWDASDSDTGDSKEDRRTELGGGAQGRGDCMHVQWEVRSGRWCLLPSPLFSVLCTANSAVQGQMGGVWRMLGRAGEV